VLQRNVFAIWGLQDQHAALQRDLLGAQAQVQRLLHAGGA